MHRTSSLVHARHEVRLDPASRLAAIYGRQQVEVASWHHQAVGRLGRGLRPVAWADDGVVEAVELEGAPALLAVQWHPEIDAAERAGDPLFDSFLAAARG